MEVISTQDIVATVTSSTKDVFGTMLGLGIQVGDARVEPVGASSFDGVVALVGVAGSWTGSGRISCSSRFACSLAGALLMSTYDAVNEEVLDAVAEVASMIVGNVKTYFEDKLGSPLGLSIPTVVFGRNYQTRFSGVQEWTIVPFDCEGEPMEVRFCLIPTPHQNSHSARRPNALPGAVLV
jgi:CheY-specific phosphatase CheX